ncbi:MAG: hypothetical protein HC866_16325 [Leptolyngbyaceae cyanobacterium RU_5_1]|nr:hypothetical protein [Leptolyngbyaceae cyanobacterium RU_5_1]
MPRIQRVPATKPFPVRKLRMRKPTSKELDLFLLAGCSCLLTVLYHPVAEALQAHHSSSGAISAIATRTSKTASNPMNAFHLTLLPGRENIQEEEEM